MDEEFKTQNVRRSVRNLIPHPAGLSRLCDTLKGIIRKAYDFLIEILQ